MARKPSVASLTRRVRSLEEQRDQLNRMLNTATDARKDAVGEAEQAKAEVEEFRRLWSSARKARDEFAATAKRYEEERDNWRTLADGQREARLKAERDRDRERGYIEGLLDGRHPERPRLPWENGTVVEGTSHWRGPSHG